MKRGPFDPWEGTFEPSFGDIKFPRPPRRVWIGLGVIAAVIAILIITRPVVDLLASLSWFQALGLGPVFTTQIEYQWGLFFVGLLVCMAYFVVNIWVALGLRGGPTLRTLGIKGRSRFWSLAGGVSLGVALLVAILFGTVLSGNWEQYALFSHYTPGAHTDPVLGMNVSFYLLSLPWLETVAGWLLGVTFLSSLLVAILYVWRGETFDLRLAPRPLGHLSVTLGFIGLVIAAETWFGRYDLMSSHNGFVAGAGYTDVTVRLPLITATTVILVAGSLGMMANVRIRRFWVPVVAVGGWILLGIIASAIPSLIQRVIVAPNELGIETPYIIRQIAGTRQAFGLQNVTLQNYPYQPQLTADQIAADQATINNLRLWDAGPLSDTYNQLQSIRTYYTFNNINLDRYTINGTYQQLELSAREIDIAKLPQTGGPTWVNQHLIYTHGYGIAASPVTAVVGEGLPDYVARDIPTAGPLTLSQPGIYFGQKTDSYVVAHTTTQEFDYPLGGSDKYTTYKGTHGVVMNSTNRLLWSMELSDFNLLISPQIQTNSQLLVNRNIQSRIAEVAPFLTLDSSPYVTVVNGKLYWIQDAYTTGSSYPYSETQTLPNGEVLAGGDNTVNYMRNSVKVVVDAYEGTMSFYVSDSSDPIIRAYQNTFPTLFQPLSAMPTGLRAHIRFPQDMFSIQTQVYAAYHVADPRVFYQREDVWSIPQEQLGPNQPLTTIAPYYVMMRLPGQSQAEYLQIMPFAPNGKPNMIAWLAVRNDGSNYGQMIAYELPKDQTIYGPQQIATLIQQQPDISSSFTLLNSSGSRVIQGSLLVVPIGNTFLYFEPVYLASSTGQALPELKKVILADANTVVYQDNLQAALASLVGQPTTPTSQGTTTPSPNPTSSTVQGLVADALTHYTQAQTDLKNSDLAGYAQEMTTVNKDLQQIQQLQGSPSPTPSPGR